MTVFTPKQSKQLQAHEKPLKMQSWPCWTANVHLCYQINKRLLLLDSYVTWFPKVEGEC